MIPCSAEEYFYKVDNMVLSASQHLRTVFKTRWKSENGEEWVDDKINIQSFLKGFGANVLKKAPAFQKKALNESDSIENWDTSLLSLVIQNFGDETKFEKENLAVRKLKDMRNDVAHHTTKKFTAEEYNENVKNFKDKLQCLGMVENDIDTLIERAGVTSSLKAYERVNVLFGEAEELMKENKFQHAIERYTEAINTPSLLPVNLGEGYEKRAHCYLKSEKNQVDDGVYCDQALLDVTQALELNSSSWNAHYLAAQCHRRKNKLSEAISHYEKSVAISPGQKQVKRDLDSCKLLAGVHSREDHLNPRLMPMNLEERVTDLESKTGVKWTGQQFLTKTTSRLMGEFIKGQDHVCRGHQYRLGWGVSLDFNEAIKYYAKADKVGNPEGSYNLAQCYHEGRGVKQDLGKAMQIYRRVAEMDKNIFGEMTPLRCNIGVASAQHSVGLMYDYGLSVEQDYREAAKWYKMAMENGIGQAANNLGILYNEGKGVPLDNKMAEMCWKEAINLGDYNAPASLMTYYERQLEPEKALDMLRIGREMGNNALKSIPDEELEKMIEEVKRERSIFEGNVTEFEKLNNLDINGLTYKERFARFTRQVDPTLEKIHKLMEKTDTNGMQIENWGGKTQPMSGEILQAIVVKAEEGSPTAHRILLTLYSCSELNDIVDTMSPDSENYQSEKLKILDLLYKCTTLEFHHMFYSSQEIKQKLKLIISQLFEEKCEKKGDDDMKTRLCYCALNLGNSITSLDDTYALEILKEGVRRYPSNPSYYDLLLCCLGFKKRFKEGVEYADEALKAIPDDPNLLYSRAVLLRNREEENSGKPNSVVVQAYEEFLKVAPRDHRKVPEAFYQISCFHLGGFVRKPEIESNLQLVELSFKQGQEAEKDQLPCYLPYGESDLKFSVEAFLHAHKNTQTLPTFPINDDSKVISVLERKAYLKSPARKGVIRLHRKNLKTYNEMRKDVPLVKTTIVPKLKQSMAKKMSVVKPITLNEMNPTEDNIYEDRILDLTLIDEPNPHTYSIICVAEDENGEVTRLYIYNVKKDKETMDMFQAGCRIALINPYMRIGAQTVNNGIRNDESRCIVYLEKVKDICRFCGEANASQKCSKCKRPYCSRECQALDWKELDHKSICSIK